MRTNIKILLVALMAMVSMNGWADVTDVTWPEGTYYFEFVGFNSTSNQKVFQFNVCDRVTNNGYSENIIQLADGIGTCNNDLNRGAYNYYYTTSDVVPMDVIVLSIGGFTIPDDQDCLKVPVGETKTSTKWDIFKYKKYKDVGTPTEFSTGVYYLKIIRGDAEGNYSVVWQTSGSLPACANAGHTVTFAANNGSLGSITTAKQGEGGSATDITSGSTLIKEETTVRLVASPTGTNVFIGWKNSSDEYVSYDADYTFSMPDDNVSLTAVFEVKRQVDGCANCFTVE